jgi:hypothetical protein
MNYIHARSASVLSKWSKCTGAFSKSGFYTLLLPWIQRHDDFYRCTQSSCTLYTFTVLRQKALAFTLPPPYVVWLPRPIGGIAHDRAPPPHGMMLDGMMTPHANPHSAHRAIGTLMTIPRFPSHPLHSRRPSITRVRNCFLAQMGVAHKPIAYPSILALHR